MGSRRRTLRQLLTARLLIAVVVLATLLVPAPPAGARTTVTVEGNVVILHVPIAMGGLKGAAGRDMETGEVLDDAALADWMESEAESIWNDQLADLPFADCFIFRVDIEITPVGRRERLPGNHNVEVMRDPTFRSMVYPPEGSPERGDFATVYTDSATGQWFPLDPSTVAHEVGHLLGLDDDYTNVGGTYRDTKSIPKPGRVGTLMEGGETVDQNLVDRLGHLLERAGERLPECWTGTIESETRRELLDPVWQQYTGGSCTDAWVTEVAFTVDEQGAVSGTFMARLTDGPRCMFPLTAPPVKDREIQISGEVSDEEIRVELASVQTAVTGGDYAGYASLLLEDPTSVRTIVVPRTGEGEATASIDYTARIASAAPADVFTSSNQIDLQQRTPSG